MKPMPRTVMCECCNKVFETGWTEEEARKELEDTFGFPTTKGCALVCDDCYARIKESIRNDN